MFHCLDSDDELSKLLPSWCTPWSLICQFRPRLVRSNRPVRPIHKLITVCEMNAEQLSCAFSPQWGPSASADEDYRHQFLCQESRVIATRPARIALYACAAYSQTLTARIPVACRWHHICTGAYHMSSNDHRSALSASRYLVWLPSTYELVKLIPKKIILAPPWLGFKGSLIDTSNKKEIV